VAQGFVRGPEIRFGLTDEIAGAARKAVSPPLRAPSSLTPDGDPALIPSDQGRAAAARQSCKSGDYCRCLQHRLPTSQVGMARSTPGLITVQRAGTLSC
jgi:hypothetical protein